MSTVYVDTLMASSTTAAVTRKSAPDDSFATKAAFTLSINTITKVICTLFKTTNSLPIAEQELSMKLLPYLKSFKRKLISIDFKGDLLRLVTVNDAVVFLELPVFRKY